jgi:hypothetical protein
MRAPVVIPLLPVLIWQASAQSPPVVPYPRDYETNIADTRRLSDNTRGAGGPLELCGTGAIEVLWGPPLPLRWGQRFTVSVVKTSMLTLASCRCHLRQAGSRTAGSWNQCRPSSPSRT